MSELKAKQALETALAGITPAIDTEYENVLFTPTAGTPYQQVSFDMDTENPELGPGHRINGLMFVRLRYPLGNGAKDALTRGELIKATFTRGRTFTAGGVNVTISKTPSVGKGKRVDDRWFTLVEIRFYANINL